MKKLTLLLAILLCATNYVAQSQSAYADMSNLPNSLYPDYYNSAIRENMRGKTMTITFPEYCIKYYDEFYLPTPDTTWLTKRKKREPRYGTDYTVRYKYTDNPKNDIEGIKFTILSITLKGNDLQFRLYNNKFGDIAVWKIYYSPTNPSSGSIEYTQIEEDIAPIRNKYKDKKYFTKNGYSYKYGDIGTCYIFKDIDSELSAQLSSLYLILTNDQNKTISVSLIELSLSFYTQQEYEAILDAEKQKRDAQVRKKEFDLKYGSGNSDDRGEVKLPPLITNKYQTITKPRLWSYDSNAAKWEYSDKSYDTYDWIKWADFKYDTTSYRVLIWEENGGYYEYPSIQVGWVSCKERHFFAITEAEFNDIKTALIKGDNEFTTIASHLYGEGSSSSKDANRIIALELIKDIYYRDGYDKSDLRYLKIKISTVNNKKYVRFEIPKTTYHPSFIPDSNKDLSKSYYEVPLATFLSLFNPIK